MAIDCAALQEQYNALQAAYMDALTGKRVVSVTYGDQRTEYINTTAVVAQLRSERDNIGLMLSAQCGIDTAQSVSVQRLATPIIGDGRCY